jgi:hypothetical protein
MVFRTAGAIATLLIGFGSAGGQALAQYYPPPRTYPPQAYPPPQGYPPRQALPPVADANTDDDTPPLNAPVLQGPPLPPLGAGPQWNGPPAGTRYGRGTPAYPADAAQPPSGVAVNGAGRPRPRQSISRSSKRRCTSSKMEAKAKKPITAIKAGKPESPANSHP